MYKRQVSWFFTVNKWQDLIQLNITFHIDVPLKYSSNGLLDFCFSATILQSSVLALDDTALDADQLENLIKFCPTKEEMELLKVLKICAYLFPICALKVLVFRFLDVHNYLCRWNHLVHYANNHVLVIIIFLLSGL